MIEISTPLPLYKALEVATQQSSMSLGQEKHKHLDAFALSTIGAFLISRSVHLSMQDNDRSLYLPPEDLQVLGFREARPDKILGYPVTLLSQFDRFSFSDAAEKREAQKITYYGRLGEMILAAERSNNPKETLDAVALGLQSPDPHVRICALSSAVKLFDLRSLNLLQRVAHYISNWSDMDIVSREIFQTLFPDVASNFGLQLMPSSGAQMPASPPPAVTSVQNNGVTLIHGTHFDFSSDPKWYFPHTGDLHQYVSNFRKDVYSQHDYYEWEGKWSDRGRHVAAKHLRNWMDLKSYDQCDLVCHSHGGNVAMTATRLGKKFNKVLFLSCPVHWKKYNFKAGDIQEAHSFRVRFDKVVFADGGAQKFPDGVVISDNTVGGWFGSHGSSKNSATWKKHSVERFLS